MIVYFIAISSIHLYRIQFIFGQITKVNVIKTLSGILQ